MELNVKQSGIEARIHTTTYYKTRSDKIHKKVHEMYVRNDIPCGLDICTKCNFTDLAPMKFSETSTRNKNSLFSHQHVILFDGATLLRFIDGLDDVIFCNVILLQSSWNYVKKVHSATYKRLNSLYQSNKHRFFVYLNEYVGDVFVNPSLNRVPEYYQELCLVKCAEYLTAHWKDQGLQITPTILSASNEAVARISQRSDKVNVLPLIDYVKGFDGCQSLIQRIIDLSQQDHRGKALYPEYFTQDRLLDGISSGSLRTGKFMLSTENYLEAFVMFDLDDQWFIQGRKDMNRSIHGDMVVVQLLPESEWSCPEKTIRLRDAEEMKSSEFGAEENELATDESEIDASVAKKAKKDVLPTARVVGILRRNWRSYCGVVIPPNILGGRQFLFAPSERLIPRIRIETSHYDQLRGKKVLVQIDSWPQDSHYPRGHYIRIIGDEGDRKTEDEVILLEHEIPYEDFSPAVLACLPKEPWKPEPSNYREDLTSLDICSVDPEGCTDIDDALHCKELDGGFFEVGVHIADVTHFVRPGTFLDQTASERSTTVYLCNRRIDMLPNLLSSFLCSLQEGELRYAFSVIWTLDSSADITSTRFCKSLIKSRRAFTYQRAQELIDDSTCNDSLANSLRNLLKLSKLLRSKRKVLGALELASSEIRFEIDPQTGRPLKVQEKRHLQTMSMIEEFMLLANVSVAEKILLEYPDCAILRRHPIPTRLSFKPLISIAESCGFQLNVDTGKDLATSLDEIQVQCQSGLGGQNPLVSRMMRMMATRCMTQAVYFAAGTVSKNHYFHYGLAAQVYTHFTSPIRRYADIMVHRLLAAVIGVDSVHPLMTDRKRLVRISENMNKRHRKAQYASRASVLLNTFMMIKNNPESCIDAIVIGVRNNGIQVMVPKYGLESVIYLGRSPENIGEEPAKNSPESALGQQRVQKILDAHGIRLFHQVKVSLNVVIKGDQRRRIDIRVVEPKLEGMSIVTDCETEIPT